MFQGGDALAQSQNQPQREVQYSKGGGSHTDHFGSMTAKSQRWPLCTPGSRGVGREAATLGSLLAVGFRPDLNPSPSTC